MVLESEVQNIQAVDTRSGDFLALAGIVQLVGALFYTPKGCGFNFGQGTYLGCGFNPR